MFESIFETATGTTDAAISIGGLLAAMATALMLGLLLSAVYMKTHKDKNPSQGFSLTLVILPAIITVIILLVGSNIARAFSLAGAFSIIRFRSAPGDPKDIATVLFAMAVGLAGGMGYMFYAAVVAILLCLAMLILEAVKYGAPKATGKLLKITIPENLDYQDAFADVLSKYTLAHHLVKVKTTDLGSLYELVFTVTTRDGVREKDFLDALRCRNGNLNITLIMNAQTGDF